MRKKLYFFNSFKAEEKLQLDVDIGFQLVDNLIPYSLEYYLGVKKEDDEEEDFEDIDDDEEDWGEEEEEDKPKKNSKKAGKKGK